MDYFTRMNVSISFGYIYAAICVAAMVGVILLSVTGSVAISAVAGSVVAVLAVAFMVRSENRRRNRSDHTGIDQA